MEIIAILAPTVKGNLHPKIHLQTRFLRSYDAGLVASACEHWPISEDGIRLGCVVVLRPYDTLRLEFA
jgi:hypothetical protein